MSPMAAQPGTAPAGKDALDGQRLALVVLALGVASRFVFLASDPMNSAWVGYLTDEGRWTHQARELALFGSLDLSFWITTAHLMVAPLFQAATFVAFALFGVGFGSARLVSAVAGSLLLVAAFLVLRRRVTPQALLLTMILLAFSPELWFLSRISIPEMTLLLFEFLAFAVLVAAPRSVLNSFLAGIVLAVGLGFKGTGFTVVPVLAAVIVVAHRPGDPSPRYLKVAAFLTALALSAAIALAGVMLVTDFVSLSQLRGTWSDFSETLGVSSPYSAVARVLYDPSVRGVRLMAMGAWAMAGALLAVGRLPDSRAKVLYLASATWSAGWLGLFLVLSYFPERYVYHAAVPLALNLGSGLALLQELGGKVVLGSLLDSDRRRRLVALWLGLPMAVSLAPLVVVGAGVAGLELDRLTEHLILIAVLDAMVGESLVRLGRSPAIKVGVMAGPVMALATRYVLAQTFFVDQGFWTLSGVGGPLLWLLLLAAATAVAALVPRMLKSPPAAQGLGVASLVAVSMVGLSQVAPALLSPTYTIRDTASELGELLGDQEVAWHYRASGIFLGNHLRAREVLGDADPAVMDFIVGIFRPLPAMTDGTYEVVREFPLDVGESLSSLERQGVDATARLFRRVPREDAR